MPGFHIRCFTFEPTLEILTSEQGLFIAGREVSQLGVRSTASAFRCCTAAVLLTLGATGCTESDHKALPVHNESQPGPSVPQNTFAARTGALAAYTGMWNDMANASHTANWRDTSLKDHANGEALAEIISGLYSMNQKGLVSKGAPVLHPRVTNSTASTADITDCASTTTWLEYVAATGKLDDSGPGGNRVFEAHVELANGTWRVTFYAVGALGSC